MTFSALYAHTVFTAGTLKPLINAIQTVGNFISNGTKAIHIMFLYKTNRDLTNEEGFIIFIFLFYIFVYFILIICNIMYYTKA